MRDLPQRQRAIVSRSTSISRPCMSCRRTGPRTISGPSRYGVITTGFGGWFTSLKCPDAPTGKRISVQLGLRGRARVSVPTDTRTKETQWSTTASPKVLASRTTGGLRAGSAAACTDSSPHPAVARIDDRRERGKVVNAAWNGYNVINAAALGQLRSAGSDLASQRHGLIGSPRPSASWPRPRTASPWPRSQPA